MKERKRERVKKRMGGKTGKIRERGKKRENKIEGKKRE